MSKDLSFLILLIVLHLGMRRFCFSLVPQYPIPQLIHMVVAATQVGPVKNLWIPGEAVHKSGKRINKHPGEYVLLQYMEKVGIKHGGLFRFLSLYRLIVGLAFLSLPADTPLNVTTYEAYNSLGNA